MYYVCVYVPFSPTLPYWLSISATSYFPRGVALLPSVAGFGDVSGGGGGVPKGGGGVDHPNKVQQKRTYRQIYVHPGGIDHPF
jgi:hypothetical protein